MNKIEKKYKGHSQKEINFKKNKKISVDVAIIPIVKWLNSYSSIKTEFSCQGGGGEKPFVLFYANNLKVLEDILWVFSNIFPNPLVEVSYYYPSIRYKLTMDNFKQIQTLIDAIKKYEIRRYDRKAKNE